ncbi:MAG: RimK family alpha-L-glutamate ligase [Candidatus Saccharimonas sp.]
MKIGLLVPPTKTYNEKRFIQEARERGHDIQVIRYLECYANISKNNPEIYYKGKSLKGIDVIMPLVSITSTDFGVALIRQFEVMHIPTAVGSLALSRARDKIRQAQIFSRRGIDTPRTAFTNHGADANALVKMVGGVPLIIKTIKGSSGNGVMLLESRKSAISTIEAFFSQSVSILIQEYIEESEGKDIRAIVVGGKVIAAIERVAIEGEFRSNLYQGGTARKVRLTSEEKRLAINAAKSMNLTTIAGVDIIQSSRGPLVSEVNACPNLQGVETATGVNVIEAVLNHMQYVVIRNHKKDKIGA